MREVLEKGVSDIKQALAAVVPDSSVSGANYNTIEDTLFVMIDTVGPGRPTVEEVRGIEQAASETLSMPVRLFVYAHPETVVSATGYEPHSNVTREGFMRMLPSMKEVSTKILEASNM